MLISGDDEDAWKKAQENLRIENEEDMKRIYAEPRLDGCTASQVRKLRSLLHSCLLALNEIPNLSLTETICGYRNTYSLASEINRTIKP